jgi:hypothetical protein
MSSPGPVVVRLIEQPPIIIRIDQPELVIRSNAMQGPAGIPGEQGVQGEQGIPGVSGASFVFDQMVAAAIWSIQHNLNRYPSVTVVDSSGATVEGAVDYDDANSLTISFSAAFAGTAYLN